MIYHFHSLMCNQVLNTNNLQIISLIVNVPQLSENINLSKQKYQILFI